MKFLVTYKMSESFLTFPPEKKAPIQQATVAFNDKYMKSGNCKELFVFGTLKEGIGIWEFASSEEMMHVISEYPLHAYVDLQIVPVIEDEVFLKVRKEMAMSARKV